MRRYLTIFFIFSIILGGFSQLLLPDLLNEAFRARAQELLGAKKIQSEITSQPELAVLLGRIDSISLTAEGVNIDGVLLHSIDVQGRDVVFSPSKISLADGQAVESAGELSLTAVFTAQDIQSMLARRTNKLSNVSAEITPESIRATAQAKIDGRMADISLAGRIIEKDDVLYFRVTKLNIRNGILSREILDEVMEDVQLFDLRRLPGMMKVRRIEHKHGGVVIKASHQSEDVK